MWITFKSCIFAFWNNKRIFSWLCVRVVNYIQILYLCILKQPLRSNCRAVASCELHSNLVSLHSETTTLRNLSHLPGCELHSNLVSLHSETTHRDIPLPLLRLWITFKSCIFAFWNNRIGGEWSVTEVVNYIQILYLCILKQRIGIWSLKDYSCELHSNLVSLHSETTKAELIPLARWLWITFKSCIFAFWNNLVVWLCRQQKVVNYIQILYLCILKQQLNYQNRHYHSCELHSNLVSLHSETTRKYPRNSRTTLWITFKSCIFAFWNNGMMLNSIRCKVVNYIQILYLCILKQLTTRNIRYISCCELHSNLVSLHSETTTWILHL